MRAGGGREGDGGATLVEFAFVVPLFFTLILGLVSGGLALNDKQQMTHAVREGARYGATFPVSEFSAGSSFALVIRQEVIDRSEGVLSPSQVCVSVVRGTPDHDDQSSTLGYTVKPLEVVSSTSGSSCRPAETYPGPTDTGDTGQRVQVTAARPDQIDVLFTSYSFTVEVEATVKSEYDS